jgi:hypothetical protein
MAEGGVLHLIEAGMGRSPTSRERAPPVARRWRQTADAMRQGDTAQWSWASAGASREERPVHRGARHGRGELRGRGMGGREK